MYMYYMYYMIFSGHTTCIEVYCVYCKPEALKKELFADVAKCESNECLPDLMENTPDRIMCIYMYMYMV